MLSSSFQLLLLRFLYYGTEVWTDTILYFSCNTKVQKLHYNFLKKIIDKKIENYFLWESEPEILGQKIKSKADCWMMENYELFPNVCVLYKIFITLFLFPYFH